MKPIESNSIDKLREFSSYSTQSVSAPPQSNQNDMSVALAKLRKAATEFATMPIEQRIALAESMQRGLMQVSEASVHAGCKAKGIKGKGEYSGYFTSATDYTVDWKGKKD